MRLGEKEFTDLMGQTIFMKREHDLKLASAGGDFKMVAAPQMPDKSKHSAHEIAQKWAMLKLMRDLDVDRLNMRQGTKIVTQNDWMLAALLSLNADSGKKLL